MPASAWICPSCTRRIPRMVDVCRCGHAWAGTEEAIADPSDSAPPPATRNSGPAIALVAALLIGVTGAVALFLRKPEADADQVALAARMEQGVPVRETRASGPAEAVADSHLPQWPSDPTLWKSSAPASAPITPVMASAPAAPRSLEDVIGYALPAVVLVETPGGRGTGFFVAPDILVTNAHVVEGNTYVTVKLSTGDKITGHVTERSDDLDLAAIRTSESRPGQATLPLASSRDARIGQELIAIGSPLGLQNTVTRGIVSALRQVGPVVLVQTDAAINPGNSGGPLIDRNGRVLAVATMRMAGRAEALGFGVGAEHVRALLDGRAPVASSASQRPADAFSPGRSDSDDGDRETAEASYERFLVEAARRADQLDGSWTDFVKDCLAGRAPSTRSDRGWYALWERFDESKVSPACTRFFVDFKMASREFHQRMTEAADEARRVGVYPGVCRQLRQRHRLDSPDW